MKRMMQSLLAAGALTCAGLVSAPATAQGLPLESGPTGTLLFFDYFLFDNAGRPQDDLRTFAQWNVTNGSVDLVGGSVPGVFTAPPIEGDGRFVDLGGSTGDPGLFETRMMLPVLAGATYNLSFAYRSTLAGQSNTATASFGGRSFTVTSNTDNFELFSGLVTGSSLTTSRIAFQGLNSDTDNSGIGIDGVLLRLVTLPGGVIPTDPGLQLPSAAVPEPSTWAMLFVGLGLVGSALRRRPRKMATA